MTLRDSWDSVEELEIFQVIYIQIKAWQKAQKMVIWMNLSFWDLFVIFFKQGLLALKAGNFLFQMQ